MICRTINLWDHPIDNYMPNISTYILESVLDNRKRGAILLCPGGGYTHISLRDKQPMAVKFNAAGYHAFVLEYSLAPTRYPQQLLDISKAVSIIRENSDEWNVDPDMIVVCGFSAGAHLSTSLGVFWDEDFIVEKTGIKKGSNKPNGLILSYPVITSGEFANRGSFDSILGEEPSEKILEKVSLEKQVNSKVPPTFIWHTCGDKSAPLENSLLFATALRKFSIPFEMHIFPNGGHGFKMDTEEEVDLNSTLPDTSTWVELTAKWLKRLAEMNNDKL